MGESIMSPPLKAQKDLLTQINIVLKKMSAHNDEKNKLFNNIRQKWEHTIKQSTLCLRVSLDIHMEVDKIFCGKELRNRSQEPNAAKVGLVHMLEELKVKLGLVGQTHTETHLAARLNDPRAPPPLFPSQ